MLQFSASLSAKGSQKVHWDASFVLPLTSQFCFGWVVTKLFINFSTSWWLDWNQVLVLSHTSETVHIKKEFQLQRVMKIEIFWERNISWIRYSVGGEPPLLKVLPQHYPFHRVLVYTKSITQWMKRTHEVIEFQTHGVFKWFVNCYQELAIYHIYTK